MRKAFSTLMSYIWRFWYLVPMPRGPMPILAAPPTAAFFSTKITSAPSSAACTAAERPAGPPAITTTCVSKSAIFYLFTHFLSPGGFALLRLCLDGILQGHLMTANLLDIVYQLEVSQML